MSPARLPRKLRPVCWHPSSSWLVFHTSLGLAWFGAAILGWSAMLQHTYQPQPTEKPASQWPKTKLAVKTDGVRIVVFAHPFCPCTQATLNSLDESLSRLPSHTSLHIVFCTAGFDDQQVALSQTMAFARRIPQVDVYCDEDGEETRLFGAKVSGEVFAFDFHGRRVFHGGVTVGRGHRGESAGQKMLERLVLGQSVSVGSTRVFGCALPQQPIH